MLRLIRPALMNLDARLTGPKLGVEALLDLKEGATKQQLRAMAEEGAAVVISGMSLANVGPLVDPALSMARARAIVASWVITASDHPGDPQARTIWVAIDTLPVCKQRRRGNCATS